MIRELTNHLWQSTLFALAAGVLTLAFRRNRAAVRYWIWFAASLKFLAPFALLIAMGDLLPKPASPPSIAGALTQIGEPIPMSFVATVPRGVDWLPLALLSAWACGFLILLFIRIRGWLQVRAAVRASVPLDLSASVEIRGARGVLEPGVVGLWRPILLLPAGVADRLPAEQLQSILAHELCHIRRRDNLLSAIHMVVETIFWFHPLVWWIGARIVAEREHACDQEVVRLGSAPREYAEAILTICKHYVESPLVCMSGVMGADLKKRIEGIMQQHKVFQLTTARKLALITLALLALALPVVLGAFHPRTVRAQMPVAAVMAPPPAATSAPTPQPPSAVPQLAPPAASATLAPTPNRPSFIGVSIDPLSRVQVRWGTPDEKVRTATGEIWRYRYLEAFHSRVEFEYVAGDRGYFPRINWPPPMAYPGEPSDPAAPGLPGKHASFQIYPVPEFRVLAIPLDSLSGEVVIEAEIRRTDATGRPKASVTDRTNASVGTWQSSFILENGSYICQLRVKEQATGQTYAETIHFEVK